MLEILKINLCSPLTLAFVLGLFAKLVRSELALPKEMVTALSVYLLLALGLKGGVELSHSSLSSIAAPALVTLLLGCLTPVTSYLVLRRLGRFGISDAAGIAAHYGSVSAVTFIAAQQFVTSAGAPAEGFMPTLLTLLEIPGIQIALAIGMFQLARQRKFAGTIDADAPAHSAKSLMHELCTSRSMLLLVGGLVIGTLAGETGWKPVQPVFEGLFKGLLCLFLLEMGTVAGSRVGGPSQSRLVPDRIRGLDAYPPRSNRCLSGMVVRAIGRRVHRSRHDGGERFLHRGPSRCTTHASRCKPDLLLNFRTRHHFSIQLARWNPNLLLTC